MILIFDTETTGLPRNYDAPIHDLDNWPRVVQIAWQLHEANGNLISTGNMVVKPEGFTIPFNAAKIHGISNEIASEFGFGIKEALSSFKSDLDRANIVAGHNISFDINITAAEFLRLGWNNFFEDKVSLDTKDLSTDFCAIPGGKGGKFKWPTLGELYQKLFAEKMLEAHDAAFDVDATAKCFFGLVNKKVVALPDDVQLDAIVYMAPLLEESNFMRARRKLLEAGSDSDKNIDISTNIFEPDANQPFVHLHVHSQYSILQSTSQVESLIMRAIDDKSPAIAMTDHGNMMGAFIFAREGKKKGIKAIIGCELNICRDRLNKKEKDDGAQVVLLAKNKNGYTNLSRLSSMAHTEGFYYVPRIDKETLLKYKEDLMVTTGGLWGEVPGLILNVGEEKAEEAFVWWKEQFGEDFYAELFRHGLEEEEVVNQTLLRFCEKYDVEYFASNVSYYTDQVDAEAQDALICVKEGEFVSKQSRYIGKRGREFRFGLPNNEFFLKSSVEMQRLFHDLPQSISTTLEIADKCEVYDLERKVLLPNFEIPQEFEDPLDLEDGIKRGENAYLRHLTYEGAIKRYASISDEIRERLDFELETIARTGYPGYFLIVQDFCNEARRQDVSVGPGRGSAAGSAVAYCIGITNIDPIKYDLLFERFLNPERVSLPDIDIDFDDEGRDKVIQYVRNKYGKHAVAQIITIGTMAAKSSIRDAGRVFELPLSQTNELAKLIPDNSSVAAIVRSTDQQLKEMFNGEDFQNAKALQAIAKGNSQEAKIVNMAAVLEGSVRNTGIHACGVIITSENITNLVPVSTAKDSDMWCTQFDNDVVESAGLLKMDFLGLKTLTLIKDSVKLIKKRHNIDLDMDNIPLDDEDTYALFQRGETIGIFQYESAGMQKYMRELKPTTFDDLIAMNALYRPGPLEYIPLFIKRKHGVEKITYDLPEMEEYLKDTYGISVYQEQVMLLSQKLGGFSKGEADILRKAMGKKQRDTLDKMKDKFVEGAMAKGHPKDKLEKVWTDWEAFASYAFNKSHSTCYAWIGYQTAYLKAHYPAEYMAAVLSNNMSDIKQVSFFMQECRKQSIPVLGPDVNESINLFSVNQQGEIRFGLAAVKGVGENAVESIIEERKSGPFKDIYDFIERVDSKTANKKVLESLVLSGAMDSLKNPRSAYFAEDMKGQSFIETLIRYGQSIRESKNSSQASLFGDASDGAMVLPAVPKVMEWDTVAQLSKEKEVVGMFISGHPLDDYEIEIRNFCNEEGLSLLTDMDKVKGRDLRFAGMVKEASHRISKNGKPFGSFILEDFSESFEFMLFGDDYMKYKVFMDNKFYLFVQGRVQVRGFGDRADNLEFKILKIELLADIKDKMAKYLTLSLRSDYITNGLVDKLSGILKSGNGKTQLRFRLVDSDSEFNAPSMTHNKIELTTELVRALEKIPEVEVAITEN
ncbi:MAG: DNA polymerase III subunit alpha [Flavobacteriales bacterium]|nr:DNA polymerase III subunit alpha [Flavobacteriales bacterium]